MSGQRILVLGPPGSGKTTLAALLASVTGLPMEDLDYHYWLPGWDRISAVDWAHIQTDLVNRPFWIISGNYQRSLALRAARADLAVILVPPRRVLLARLARRTVGRLLGERDSLPPALHDAPPHRTLKGLGRLIYLGLRYERRVLPATVALLTESGVPHLILRTTDDEAALFTVPSI